MYPVIPAELTQSAIQLVVCFVALLGTMSLRGHQFR